MTPTLNPMPDTDELARLARADDKGVGLTVDYLANLIESMVFDTAFLWFRDLRGREPDFRSAPDRVQMTSMTGGIRLVAYQTLGQVRLDHPDWSLETKVTYVEAALLVSIGRHPDERD